jgi:hypothetical protein
MYEFRLTILAGEFTGVVVDIGNFGTDPNDDAGLIVDYDIVSENFQPENVQKFEAALAEMICSLIEDAMKETKGDHAGNKDRAFVISQPPAK